MGAYSCGSPLQDRRGIGLTLRLTLPHQREPDISRVRLNLPSTTSGSSSAPGSDPLDSQNSARQPECGLRHESVASVDTTLRGHSNSGVVRTHVFGRVARTRVTYPVTAGLLAARLACAHRSPALVPRTTWPTGSRARSPLNRRDQRVQSSTADS